MDGQVRFAAATSMAACVLFLIAGCAPKIAPLPKAGAADIAGVVAGQHGGEAGVWVIAESKDLPTRFARIVVTDDQGRFLVPDLPKASYRVFARGYGILDTPSVQTDPGAAVTLRARDASAADAAKVYPAAYWYSMLHIPSPRDFSGAARNPLIPTEVTRAQWIMTVKEGACVGCHQMGDLATRTIPKMFASEGSSESQWLRRIQSGQAGENMLSSIGPLGPQAPKTFADWTDRIAKGDLPKAKPTRPQGMERNVVITTWDWLDDQHYLHDPMSTDARNPTVNANGLVYGSTELSVDAIPYLDPNKNTVGLIDIPVRDPDTPIAAPPPGLASPYWGEQAIWDSRTNIHNQMFDDKGRLWMTATLRDPANQPDYCKTGSASPSAQAVPLNRSGRQIGMLDPKTGKYSFVDTCYANHHLQFDAKGWIWTSGGGPVVGWLDVPTWDRTHDAGKAQGWTPLIVDTNGNGKRDAYVAPGQPGDPNKDTQVIAPFYAIMPNLADGSVWGSVFAGSKLLPWALVRVDPGSDPARTALSEVYQIPAPYFGIRGAAISSQGVVWAGLASGQLASFDRRKCKGPLNGPKAGAGQLCPEGWSFYRLPGPTFESDPDLPTEASYYTWVDQHDTLGLGADVPIVIGNEFDGFHALVNGKFITMRLPYPLGFYAKGLDGRIDDPNSGWKGRGLWTTSGDRTPWHHEGGKGTKPVVMHIQMRPNPLAN